MAGELYRKISHVGDQTIPRGWRQVIPTPSVKEFPTSGLQVRAQRMPPSAGTMEGTPERTAWLQELRELASDGRISLRVAGEYPPEQAAEAQRVMAAGGLRGRAVIVF